MYVLISHLACSPHPQLCQHEEDYQGMLKELAMAAALDPDWATPRERLATMWSFFTAMAAHISNKVPGWMRLGRT